MLHPNAKRHPSPIQGLGVFATAPLPKGTILWSPCAACRILTPAALTALSPAARTEAEHFGFHLADGRLWISCGDTPYLNHSCDANVLDHGLDFCLVVRDIAPGEEITQDYRTFSDDPPGMWELACRCGAPSCTGRVGPEDGRSPSLQSKWKDAIAAAVALTGAVPQPLAATLRLHSEAFRHLEARGPRGLLDAGYSLRKPPELKRSTP